MGLKKAILIVLSIILVTQIALAQAPPSVYMSVDEGYPGSNTCIDATVNKNVTYYCSTPHYFNRQLVNRDIVFSATTTDGSTPVIEHDQGIHAYVHYEGVGAQDIACEGAVVGDTINGFCSIPFLDIWNNFGKKVDRIIFRITLSGDEPDAAYYEYYIYGAYPLLDNYSNFGDPCNTSLLAAPDWADECDLIPVVVGETWSGAVALDTSEYSLTNVLVHAFEGESGVTPPEVGFSANGAYTVTFAEVPIVADLVRMYLTISNGYASQVYQAMIHISLSNPPVPDPVVHDGSDPGICDASFNAGEIYDCPEASYIDYLPGEDFVISGSFTNLGAADYIDDFGVSVLNEFGDPVAAIVSQNIIGDNEYDITLNVPGGSGDSSLTVDWTITNGVDLKTFSATTTLLETSVLPNPLTSTGDWGCNVDMVKDGPMATCADDLHFVVGGDIVLAGDLSNFVDGIQNLSDLTVNVYRADGTIIEETECVAVYDDVAVGGVLGYDITCTPLTAEADHVTIFFDAQDTSTGETALYILNQNLAPVAEVDLPNPAVVRFDFGNYDVAKDGTTIVSSDSPTCFDIGDTPTYSGWVEPLEEYPTGERQEITNIDVTVRDADAIEIPLAKNVTIGAFVGDVQGYSVEFTDAFTAELDGGSITLVFSLIDNLTLETATYTLIVPLKIIVPYENNVLKDGGLASGGTVDEGGGFDYTPPVYYYMDEAYSLDFCLVKDCFRATDNYSFGDNSFFIAGVGFITDIVEFVSIEDGRVCFRENIPAISQPLIDEYLFSVTFDNGCETGAYSMGIFNMLGTAPFPNPLSLTSPDLGNQNIPCYGIVEGDTWVGVTGDDGVVANFTLTGLDPVDHLVSVDLIGAGDLDAVAIIGPIDPLGNADGSITLNDFPDSASFTLQITVWNNDTTESKPHSLEINVDGSPYITQFLDNFCTDPTTDIPEGGTSSCSAIIENPTPEILEITITDAIETDPTTDVTVTYEIKDSYDAVLDTDSETQQLGVTGQVDFSFTIDEYPSAATTEIVYTIGSRLPFTFTTDFEIVLGGLLASVTNPIVKSLPGQECLDDAPRFLVQGENGAVDAGTPVYYRAFDQDGNPLHDQIELTLNADGEVTINAEDILDAYPLTSGSITYKISKNSSFPSGETLTFTQYFTGTIPTCKTSTGVTPTTVPSSDVESAALTILGDQVKIGNNLLTEGADFSGLGLLNFTFFTPETFVDAREGTVTATFVDATGVQRTIGLDPTLNLKPGDPTQVVLPVNIPEGDGVLVITIIANDPNLGLTPYTIEIPIGQGLPTGTEFVLPAAGQKFFVSGPNKVPLGTEVYYANVAGDVSSVTVTFPDGSISELPVLGDTIAIPLSLMTGEFTITAGDVKSTFSVVPKGEAETLFITTEPSPLGTSFEVFSTLKRSGTIKTEYAVLDPAGKKIATVPVEVGSDTPQKFSVDLSGQPTGIYTLQPVKPSVMIGFETVELPTIQFEHTASGQVAGTPTTKGLEGLGFETGKVGDLFVLGELLAILGLLLAGAGIAFTHASDKKGKTKFTTDQIIDPLIIGSMLPLATIGFLLGNPILNVLASGAVGLAIGYLAKRNFGEKNGIKFASNTIKDTPILGTLVALGVVGVLTNSPMLGATALATALGLLAAKGIGKNSSMVPDSTVIGSLVAATVIGLLSKQPLGLNVAASSLGAGVAFSVAKKFLAKGSTKLTNTNLVKGGIYGLLLGGAIVGILYDPVTGILVTGASFLIALGYFAWKRGII